MDHSEAALRRLIETAWEYYRTYGRDLPWRQLDHRGQLDPYHVLVSEIMLQQTQVARVIPKYQQFLERFPTASVLGAVPLGEVLAAWSGLGYNRRAKYLWQAAQMVQETIGGRLPTTLPELQRLPGVGFNTAAAVAAYAYNTPVPFIETNIRTVYIYHFFPDAEAVADNELLPLITATLPLVGRVVDGASYREWYWALMDYGSFLKTAVGNRARQSKHYTRQSAFAGSIRQARGQIVRILSVSPEGLSLAELQQQIPDDRLVVVLDALVYEGLITCESGHYHL